MYPKTPIGEGFSSNLSTVLREFARVTFGASRATARRHVETHSRTGGPAPQDLRHHRAPRRRQDHADGAYPAVRRGHPGGRRGAGARREPAHTVRLDEDRKGARHLRLRLGDDVRAHHVGRRGQDVQPARHAGPRGLLGRHLSHPDRRRLRHHGAGRRQGHRAPDAETVRGLPPARHPDHHLHQQAGPRGPGPDGPAGRDRVAAPARPLPHLVAGRERQPPARHGRDGHRPVPALRQEAGRFEGRRASPGRPAAGRRRRSISSRASIRP